MIQKNYNYIILNLINYMKLKIKKLLQIETKTNSPKNKTTKYFF